MALHGRDSRAVVAWATRTRNKGDLNGEMADRKVEVRLRWRQGLDEDDDDDDVV
jgi:hypothetical protein